MRRLDPHRTPQELQPAKVPTVLVFGIGTLAWLAVLVVLGARHLLGYGVDGQVAVIATAGVGLGLIGLLWARVHTRRQQTDTPPVQPPSATPAPENQDRL